MFKNQQPGHLNSSGFFQKTFSIPVLTGLVYTVDPETGSFLLLNGDTMTMVPGASVLQHTVNTTFLHSVSIHPELPQGDLEGLDTLDNTLQGLDTIDDTLFKLLAVHKLSTNECAARRAELLEFVKLHRLALFTKLLKCCFLTFSRFKWLW